MAWDILEIKNELAKGEYDYITTILLGKQDGWVSYGDLTDEEIDLNFKEALEDNRLDDEVQELAKKLSDTFIKASLVR